MKAREWLDTQNDVAPEGRRRNLKPRMQIVETLAPVFLIIAFGWFLRRRHWLGDDFLGEANRVVYWIGLPAFLLISLAAAPTSSVPVGRLVLMLLGATAAIIGLALLTGRFLGIPRESLGTFAQAAYRCNMAYVALPILGLLPSGHGPWYTAALLAMAPTMAFFNAAAVLLLLSSRQATGPGMWRRVGLELAKNPLIWASVVGGIHGYMRWPVPPWVEHTVGTVGQMSLPLALICIGGALAATRLTGNRRRIVAASVLKLAGQPLCGLALAWILGMGPVETQVGLVLLATPTSAASYTMATQLGGDEDLAAGSVVLSTLLSVFALAAAVAYY